MKGIKRVGHGKLEIEILVQSNISVINFIIFNNRLIKRMLVNIKIVAGCECWSAVITKDI